MLDFSPGSRRNLARLQFTCLDEQWRGVAASYRFQCRQGHVIVCTALHLKGLLGCRLCREASYVRRLTQSAAQGGSQCLDTERPWKGVGTRYRFRCLRNPEHTWLRTYRFAVKNASCPYCSLVKKSAQSRDRKGLQRLQAAAQKHGGECLASAFIGVNHKYPFRCANGHTWEALGSRILRGENWCRRCHSDRIRLTLEDMRQAAAARGGECLSTEYHTYTTHYHWRCARGHSWRTTFAKIRQGHWCSTCAYMASTRVGSDAWKRYQTALNT